MLLSSTTPGAIAPALIASRSTSALKGSISLYHALTCHHFRRSIAKVKANSLNILCISCLKTEYYRKSLTEYSKLGNVSTTGKMTRCHMAYEKRLQLLLALSALLCARRRSLPER